jgi:hypothetical protein
VAPSKDVDSIATARRGAESRAPAVAIDVVSRNCRRDESSKKNLLEQGENLHLSAWKNWPDGHSPFEPVADLHHLGTTLKPSLETRQPSSSICITGK